LTRMKMLDIMAIGRTHQGMVRSNNEDSFCVDKELGLFMVADGMGGHASGEVASRMAVEIIKETFEKSLKDKDVPLVGRMDPGLSAEANRLLSSIRFANRAIFEMSQKGPEFYGMGTTLVGLLAQADHMIQVHVGDSRIYRFRSGQVTQLTEDHSLVLHQVKLGLLTEDEARASRAKNVITRAIGVLRDVEVDLQMHEWVEGDTYVLCSDGLSDLLSADEIGQLLESTGTDLGASGDALIQMALDRGGHDNVTVVLVRLGKMKHRAGLIRGTIGRIFRGHAEA
jgi:serine/threonine protein phosphatase PrpC